MQNSGISGGWWPGVPIGVIAVVWLIGLWFWYRAKGVGARVGWGLVLGGGLLNLSERWRYGYVRDPWNLGGIVYNNLADYFIAVGLLIYLYSWWRKR